MQDRAVNQRSHRSRSVDGDFAYALAGMAEAEQVAANVAPMVGNLQSQAAGRPSDAFSAAVGGRVAADLVAADYALAGVTSGDGGGRGMS